MIPRPLDRRVRAYVDGDEVPRSVETVGDDLSVTYTDGWSYLPSENAVEFHGAGSADSVKPAFANRPGATCAT